MQLQIMVLKKVQKLMLAILLAVIGRFSKRYLHWKDF